MTHRSRIFANYNKVCRICGTEFYSKNFNVKYCCQSCADIAYKEQQRIASAKYYKKQKEVKKSNG